MRSSSLAPADDRTAKARIRDAAIARFAADGVAATSVRAIATDAGVSPGLVIHHFGSKDALRVECDTHVAAIIRAQKRAVMAAGPGIDPLAALRAQNDGPPLLQYLARTLVDGSPHVRDLVDEMVDDAAAYMSEGVKSGVLRPTAYPYERAAVLTVWSLGALVLHEHIERLLGIDLTGPFDASSAFAYIGPATEMLTDGVVTDEMGARMKDAFADMTGATTGNEEEEGS
jgi:AcrR family transcriptional regulator